MEQRLSLAGKTTAVVFYMKFFALNKRKFGKKIKNPQTLKFPLDFFNKMSYNIV